MISKKRWPAVTSLTDEQKQSILCFLAERRKIEKMRKISLMTLCTIFLLISLLNQNSASPWESWQIILTVLAVMMTMSVELMMYFIVKKYKRNLVDLGLPIEFASTVSRINIKKMDQEVAN